jgi:tetratricopeptide (TPR) repeat protein
MPIKLISTTNDSVILSLDTLGILVGIVPSRPSSDGAFDVFHGLIRFTNVVRATKVLTEGGSFTTDDGHFQILGNEHTCDLAFEYNHAPGEWFECKLSVSSTDQLIAFLRDSLAGKNISGPQAEYSSTVAKIGRNETCPCGSGRKFKKCCMRNAEGFKVQLPSELLQLKTIGDEAIEALIIEFMADPRLAQNADFWNSIGNLAGQNKLPSIAISAAKKAISISPNDHLLQANLAVHLAQSGKVVEALELITAIPEGTNRKSIMTANILQDLGRHDEAIPLYEKAIEEEPDFYLPYARILNSLKATRSALYDLWLERAITAQLHSPIIAQYFVRRCLDTNNIEDLANAMWLETLASDAGRADVIGRNEDDPRLIVESQLAHQAARVLYDRDTELLSRVLEILKAIPVQWHFCEPAKIITSVSAQLGSVDGVHAAFARICDDCRKNLLGLEADLDGYLAVAHSKRGNYHEAKKLCERVLSIDPNNIMVLWHHWWVLDELDESELAVSQAERLYQLRPDTELLCYNLGYLCGKDGQIGKSIHYYRKETEQRPDNFLAFENLSFAQILQSDLIAARASYESYRRLVKESVDDIEFDSAGTMNFSGMQFIRKSDRNSAVAPLTFEDALTEKDEKFESLVVLAMNQKGNTNYIYNLINANQISLPIIGAINSIRPEYLTDQRILDGILGTPAAKEEIEFQLNARKRGDVSFAYASISKDFPNWNDLPEAAISSLVEAERIFLSGASLDSAPYIVAYAKAIEVYLHEVVFGKFRDVARVSFTLRQLVQDALAEGKNNKVIALAKFIDNGSALTLGTMNFFLPLCTGKSAGKIPLIGKLRDHIVGTLRLPKLLEQSTIDELKELADVYRNKAAHEKRFHLEDCRKTRELVMKLLRIVAIPHTPIPSSSSESPTSD